VSRPIRRARQVRDDIIAIYQYVHDRSPQSAEKVLDAIECSIRALADAPGIGTYWNSPHPGLDGIKICPVRPYRNYLIFFRKTPDAVEVFRVVHGARELGPLIDDVDLDLGFEEPD
jgi:toxin ParE1/3/4